MRGIEYWKRWSAALAAGAGAIAMTGCAMLGGPVADSISHYILDTADYEPVASGEAEDPLVIGLARVRVARYLDVPGLAIREQGHTVRYSIENRWAEPLEASLSRLLTENLGSEASVRHVVAYSTPSGHLPDYDLHVSVTRAEGVLPEGGAPRAVFRATWELRSGRQAETVASGQVREDDLPWDGRSYDQLAASMSGAAAELTRQIARALDQLEP